MAPDEQLLKAIEEFEIDDPQSHLPFSKRLARDMNWSPGYARRAIDEYLRFIYLAMTAGHPVTPSEEVDQVWHLHLAYTRSYWDDLCGKILGRPLHHGPTRGGEQERARYDQQYRQTLDSYARAFGGKPPKDIWPPPEERFRRARYHIVDRSIFWLAPRFTKGQAIAAAIPAGAAFLFVLIFRRTSPSFYLMAAALWPLSFMFIYTIGAIAGDFTRRSISEAKDEKNDNGSGGGCAAGCGGGCGGGCS